MDDLKNKVIELYQLKEHDQCVDLLFDNIKELALFLQNNINENCIKQFDKNRLDDQLKNKEIYVFRSIILSLISEKKELLLMEQEELKHPTSNIEYIVTIGDDMIKSKLFCLYLMIYYVECKFRVSYHKNTVKDIFYTKPHVGIDYEFNNRKIALMQLNFETPRANNEKSFSYIWLVNPGEFTPYMMNYLLQFLMINMDIYKILHGSESLDIPYMYEHMLKVDDDKITLSNIINFTKKVIDTRFLCEYYRFSIQSNKKCSIYNALLFFQTITQEKFDELEGIHDSMGPVQDISWSIHKLSSYHKKYALYDVLFLQHMLSDIYKQIHMNTDQYVNTYRYIVEITRFIFLERREIIDVLDFCKDYVNPLNNNMIIVGNNNITLDTIYKKEIDGFIVNDGTKKIYIDFLLSVGYFKKSLTFLFKFLIFYNVNKNYKVYKKKNVPINDGINSNNYNDCLFKLRSVGFDKIVNMMVLFQEQSEKILKSKYKN